MWNFSKATGFAMVILLMGAFLAGCSSDVITEEQNAQTQEASIGEEGPPGDLGAVKSAVYFDHDLDSYAPKKENYNFYFTYKTVHSWWDAVALGM